MHASIRQSTRGEQERVAVSWLQRSRRMHRILDMRPTLQICGAFAGADKSWRNAGLRYKRATCSGVSRHFWCPPFTIHSSLSFLRRVSACVTIAWKSTLKYPHLQLSNTAPHLLLGQMPIYRRRNEALPWAMARPANQHLHTTRHERFQRGFLVGFTCRLPSRS